MARQESVFAKNLKNVSKVTPNYFTEPKDHLKLLSEDFC